MKKSEEKKYNLQSNTDTSLNGVALHSVCLDNNTNKSDSIFSSTEPEDSSSGSFFIIYGILSEIDKNCQYIKLKTKDGISTYYIQQSLFNPNSSINKSHQFITIVPLSLEHEYVAVFLDSSQKVIDVQRVKPNKNIQPKTYSFPDKKNLSSTADTDINTLNNQCINSPGRPKRDTMTDTDSNTALSYNNTSFTGDACHSASARAQYDPSIPNFSIKSESEDTTISSDSDFFSLDLFSEYDEPEPDLLIQDPLYPSYQNMQNYIPYSINIKDFLKYNYVFNMKLNSKHSNSFFTREVCYILAQLLLGNAHLISAVAPTKMSYTKFQLIKSKYERLHTLYTKTQNILKNQNAKRQLLAYIFYNLQYITEGLGSYEYSYNTFIKRYQSDKSLSQNLPNRKALYTQIKDYSKKLETLLNKAKHNYDIALKYKTKFNEEAYGELHIHGFLPDIYNFEQNCNYDYKFDKYGHKIYIIPINYIYKGSLKSSKVELCIQHIDSKRYNSKLKSIEYLLNYFYGPQNQPTFYFSTQTFNKYNGSSVLRNIQTTQFQFKTNNQTIDGITYKPTLLQCDSNQIPTFTLPGDSNDHTIFDFFPNLQNHLDKLFPNLYDKFPEIFPSPKTHSFTVPKPDIPPSRYINIYYNIESNIFNNAGYTSFIPNSPDSLESPNTPEIPETPELIPTIYRLPEISSTAKRLYLFILSHFFVNNYSAFTQLKSSTTLLANSNPENNIYTIAHSTVPSLHTLADYIQIAENKYGKSISIHPSPDETLAELPAHYWQLFCGTDSAFEPLFVPEIEANLSQHNKLCLEASRSLQNQFSLSTNIFKCVQPENGLESLLEPLNAKLKNYDSFTPDSLSTQNSAISQIYKNSHCSSFSFIIHKNYLYSLNLHQNTQNYVIPYIDDS